jgi:hypothetical protein
MPEAIKSDAAATPVSADAAIRVQLAAAEFGRVFSPTDFISLGSRSAVDKVLSRLTPTANCGA